MAHCSQIRARTFQRILRKVWAEDTETDRICGKGGHGFTPLVAQRQENTGRTYGDEKEQKQLSPEEMLGTPEEVAVFCEVGTCDTGIIRPWKYQAKESTTVFRNKE